MAEKAIRLGGESTAAAITQAVQELYPEHKFTEAEFARKDNAAEIAVDTNFAAQSFWKDVRIRFFRKKSAVLGLVMIMIILLLAIFGPGMNAYTYSGQDLSQKNFAPRVPGIEQFGILDGSEKMSTTTGTKIVNNYVEKGKDDVYYWFGSDLYGRDIWTRTWEGARVSLIIAVAAAVIDMVIGMSYGLISGYFGGKVDMLMQRFLEVANGIPRLVIVTLLLLVLQPGMITIIFALMLTEWVGMSRIARALRVIFRRGRGQYLRRIAAEDQQLPAVGQQPLRAGRKALGPLGGAVGGKALHAVVGEQIKGVSCPDDAVGRLHLRGVLDTEVTAQHHGLTELAGGQQKGSIARSVHRDVAESLPGKVIGCPLAVRCVVEDSAAVADGQDALGTDPAQPLGRAASAAHQHGVALRQGDDIEIRDHLAAVHRHRRHCQPPPIRRKGQPQRGAVGDGKAPAQQLLH